MSKIKLYMSLKENENIIYNRACFNGIKSSNTIMYNENSSKVKIIINDNSINLIKKDDDHELDLTFKNNKKSQSFIKTNEGILNITINTLKFNIDKKIEIMYYVEETSNKYEFILDWGE